MELPRSTENAHTYKSKSKQTPLETMGFMSSVDLSSVTWHAFSREAMFDRRWYLRSQRLGVYTATLLIGMAAQGAATYCMFKYKFLRKHIANVSMHAAHVHDVDITATTILSMIFPCLLSLLLNTEYFYLLFWPGRKFSKRYNMIFEWSMAGVTGGMLATIVSSTVVVATRSASISGVDASTARQLTDLYFRPPFKYRSWPQNIVWIVLMWITFAFNIASVVLMRLASSHDRKKGSNLIVCAVEESSRSGTPPQRGSKDKASEVTVEEKSIIGLRAT